MTELEKLIARLENDDQFIDAISDAISLLVAQSNEISILQNERVELTAANDAMNKPQPCGHTGRYIVSTPHGTHVCALCVIDSVCAEV